MPARALAPPLRRQPSPRTVFAISPGASDVFAPGSILTINGDRLTSGSNFDAGVTPLPVRLSGTHVEVNGIPAPLFSVKPDRLLLPIPADLMPGQPASLTISSVNLAAPTVPLRIETAAPAIVAAAGRRSQPFTFQP